MAGRLRLLIVEDSEDDALLVVREVRRAGWEPEFERVETAAAMMDALDRHPWDVVIADYSLPRFSGPAALALLKARGFDLPFIIVSGTIGEAAAVAAMKAGAHDYLMKGNLGRLVPVIERELGEAEERRRRAHAEQALAAEREYSRILVEGVNALIVGLDLEGRITLFNPAAEATTGYRAEDVRGRSWFDVIVPRARYPEVWDAFRSIRTTGQPDELENVIVTTTGEERVIAWRNSLLRTDGGIVGVISFGIDVTDRRRAERDRVAMERAARQAEKLAALGTLAAGLAHELNNPIGIISSRIELMLLEAESGSVPASLVEDLHVVHRHAQRMARLAQGLLSFGRHPSGERRPVELDRVVEETLLLAGKQIAKDGIRLVTRLGHVPPILGDAGTLQQVVLNLVTNARDAIAGEAGEIRISTAASGARPGEVELVVEDTGTGIAPADAGRIFDPFFTTKPTGTGLGLSITEGIVREHGGTIDVESSPGHTRFVLRFPCARS